MIPRAKVGGILRKESGTAELKFDAKKVEFSAVTERIVVGSPLHRDHEGGKEGTVDDNMLWSGNKIQSRCQWKGHCEPLNLHKGPRQQVFQRGDEDILWKGFPSCKQSPIRTVFVSSLFT